jgi:FixJ family two-component response regulator
LFPRVSINGATIYLLDDDPFVLKATSRMLSQAGLKVQSFSDPFTFLAHACDHQPRVVVVDVLMPIMNGLEVQRRLRHISPFTRVIILSSRDDAIVRATAMRQGASAFFLKGVENKQFLDRIEAALKKSDRQTGGTSEEVSSGRAIHSHALDR